MKVSAHKLGRFAQKQKFRLLRRIGWRMKTRYTLDYQPEPGQQSAKAERLVDFCLGDFKHRPVVPFRKSRSYLQDNSVLKFEASRRQVVLSARPSCRKILDQKGVVDALTDQRAAIPTPA